MDLPDCPPGAEGYEDSVTEVRRKPELEDSACTKAELEFQEHLNSLKIRLEDGSIRCMVERRGRDISSNWIYLCYPCAAVCSGESILQTHISGKKHKTKLSLKNVWPVNILEEHPYILKEKGVMKSGATTEINQKMAEEVILHNKNPSELDLKYNKYRDVICHIQETLDAVKAPLVGIEYLIEHPPEQMHYEPLYLCTLCSKQGHPRTIVNHLTCFWHRCNYLARHFPKASSLLAPHRRRSKNREGVQTVVNRLTQRIDDKYGRLKPINIDKEEFEKDKERIFQWIFKGFHFSEELGHTFEEVVDEELINSLALPDSDAKTGERNPSPPVVPAPTKPQSTNRPTVQLRQHKHHGSTESLSDVSDDDLQRPNDPVRDLGRSSYRGKYDPLHKASVESYPDQCVTRFRSRYAIKNITEKNNDKTRKPQNHNYKMKLAEEKKQAAIEAAKKTLAYHEKNPEKHPLYPEEWKKFWNKRYKEIQAEGKDPSKHDFKPEWISFWTNRMKELHDEELRVNVTELFRKMGLPPPELETFCEGNRNEGKRSPFSKRRSPTARSRSPVGRRSIDLRRRFPDPRRRSPDPRRRSPDFRRRSPDCRRRSPDLKRRSPDFKRRSPDLKRRSPTYRRHSPDSYRRKPVPPRRKSPEPRRRTPVDFRRDRRSPLDRSNSQRHRTPDHRRSPQHSRSPIHKRTSPAGGGVGRRSSSPLSQRAAHRNRSPHAPTALSLQTVLISDDELRPDDGLSPWNSDNDIESVSSVNETRSRGVSVTSRHSRTRRVSHGHYGPHVPHGPLAVPQDFGPADNVVATLRLLVALEDYLGSMGPKIIDLLTEAIRMEKEKANSSEEMLERESVVALLETAKEKLKGAVQAGLVFGSAATAVRTAVVRVAAALHEADKRVLRTRKAATESKAIVAPVAVAGVGSVDRAEIAEQMAAALVAEGRTDVSPEELAQLVDAVVGMAEAKKREIQAKKLEVDGLNNKPNKLPTLNSSTTSALQMLQSAYDDRNPSIQQKENASDAMDGLSDSDLETLLKNFNELSAEEQHSLIAYLKKLEVREPQRVEKLRQFVGAPAANASVSKDEHKDTMPVPIESDDDDYTVEDVVKSATQKVKESQIQQEMEIVKKSLEETKMVVKPVETEHMKVDPSINIMQNISSAADLLALVQASIQSTSQSMPDTVNQTADVVTSNNQPRSFGDIPESRMLNMESNQSLMSTQVAPNLTLPEQPTFQNIPNNYRGGTSCIPQSMMNFGGNTNETYNQNMLGHNRQSLMTDNRESLMTERQNPMITNRQTFMRDNMQPYRLDNIQHLIKDNSQLLLGDNRQSLMGDNRQSLMGDNRQSLMGDNRQSLMGDKMQHFIGDNRQILMGDNMQTLMGDNRPLLMGDNRQSLIGDNRQSLIGDNRQSLIGEHSRQPLMGDNRQPLMTGNWQPFGGQSNKNNWPSLMTDNRSENRQKVLMDESRQQPLSGDNRQPLVTDNREPIQSGCDNYNQGKSYNPGGQINFRNDLMQQNNYSARPEMNQQNFGNYNNNPNANFRGRGRGSGPVGRGRRRGRN